MDDRTQVQAVTLRTEAELLKAWVAHREAVERRRREGPLEALRHRHRLLEREVPRLELEVRRLEKVVARPLPGAATAFVSGALRGLVVALAAVAWIVGVAVWTPDAHVHDPARLVAVAVTVAFVIVARLGSGGRS